MVPLKLSLKLFLHLLPLVAATSGIARPTKVYLYYVPMSLF